jgi:tetratricopeptide (TPR) repeat protein
MSSRTPVIRQVAWISIVPHMLEMGGIMFLWSLFNEQHYILFGATTYLIISQSLRRIIAKDQRAGMVKVKQEKFNEAIPYFEKSYDFFKKYHWIDQYRYITLLSSARTSYKEMALVNIAYCYGQMGEGAHAKKVYERALSEYPNSGIAKAGLRLMNAISGSWENKSINPDNS